MVAKPGTDRPVTGETLPASAQRRNSLVFFLNNAIAYFVAPALYVGVLHAAILHSLGKSDTIANLPQSVYLWATPAPVLIAWLWPSPRLLRPMLAAALALAGTAGLVVAVSFAVAPVSWLVPALVAHASVIGVTNGVRQMCLWELVGRGLSAERRGWTLGWTFGLGPVFAVAGSMASQLVLSGNFFDVVRVPPVPAPWSYVIVFGATAPALWLAAALVRLTHVPPLAAAEDAPRSTTAQALTGVRLYLSQPWILLTAAAFLLTYFGTMVLNNLSLYARETIGQSPESYAGLQLALRFGFKCIAGFALGWLVTRVHAKASLLTTTAICLVGVAWALLVPGRWYLLSFGLLGAGELFYVYYLNYIVGCSPQERIRENTAYTNLLGALVGFGPLFFGVLSDHYGLRASFSASLAILTAAILIAWVGLPRQPVAVDEMLAVREMKGAASS